MVKGKAKLFHLLIYNPSQLFIGHTDNFLLGSPQDSLELRTVGGSVYRNPAMIKPRLQENPTNSSGFSKGSSVYIIGSSDPVEGREEILPGEVRRSFKFSAGEKMTISISRDQQDHVFSGDTGEQIRIFLAVKMQLRGMLPVLSRSVQPNKY